MKKKVLKFIAFITLAFVALGMIRPISHTIDYIYSKKLVQAIHAEDIAAIEKILEKRPSSINTYPQFLQEKLFYIVLEGVGPTYPLLTACEKDNLDIVKMLVEAGADVDCNDWDTPLSVTYCGKKEHWYQISTYLIENGASLDYITSRSWGYSSTLSDIVRRRRGSTIPGDAPDNEADVMNSFLYALEHCDHSKVPWVSVLNRSVTYDRIEIVELLLDGNYCDVNDANDSGWTALICAANYSTPEMVQLLLDRGADKDYKNSEGKTAYDYAIECENYEIAEMLSN